MNKIEIKQIRFIWSESNDIPDSPFYNWSDAEKALSKVTAPDIGYYKTGFEIVWQDGEIYEGRFDIGSDADSLKDHILNFLNRMIQRKDGADCAKKFIANYQIGA